jgi:hypothetical protein
MQAMRCTVQCQRKTMEGRLSKKLQNYENILQILWKKRWKAYEGLPQVTIAEKCASRREYQHVDQFMKLHCPIQLMIRDETLPFLNTAHALLV